MERRDIISRQGEIPNGEISYEQAVQAIENGEVSLTLAAINATLNYRNSQGLPINKNCATVAILYREDGKAKVEFFSAHSTSQDPDDHGERIAWENSREFRNRKDIEIRQIVVHSERSPCSSYREDPNKQPCNEYFNARFDGGSLNPRTDNFVYSVNRREVNGPFKKPRDIDEELDRDIQRANRYRRERQREKEREYDRRHDRDDKDKRHDRDDKDKRHDRDDKDKRHDRDHRDRGRDRDHRDRSRDRGHDRDNKDKGNEKKRKREEISEKEYKRSDHTMLFQYKKSNSETPKPESSKESRRKRRRY